MKNHNKKLMVSTLNSPRVVIDWQSLERLRYLVGKVPTECQWFHRVRKEVVDGDPVYYISDFYIPEQQVSGTTVESDAEVMVKLANEVKERVGGFNAEFNEILSTLSCWCHSHVNMPCVPSGTDDTQFKEQITQAIDGGSMNPQMMIIFNKRDEYFIRVYEPETGLLFENVPLQFEDNRDWPYISEAIKNKIKARKYTNTMSGVSRVPRSHHGSTSGYYGPPTGSGSSALRQHYDNTNTARQTAGTASGHVPSPSKNPARGAQGKEGTETSGPVGSQTGAKEIQEELIKRMEEIRSGATLTEELSYVEAFELGDTLVEENATKIVELLASIADSDDDNPNRELWVSELMEILTGAFTDHQLDILSYLVFGELDNALELVSAWNLVDEDTYYVDTQKDLRDHIENSDVEPPEFFLEAIKQMMLLVQLKDDLSWEAALTYWYSSTLDPEAPDGADEEAEEEMQEAIEELMAEVDEDFETEGLLPAFVGAAKAIYNKYNPETKSEK